MQKPHCELFQPFFLHCDGELAELLCVEVGVDRVARLQQLPEDHALRVPKNGQHQFATVWVRLWLRWRAFAAEKPEGVAHVVIVTDPAFICSHNLPEKVLSIWVKQQRFTYADSR